MKRPQRLSILGKTWKVTYGPPEAKDEIGECLSETQSITVKDGLSAQQESSTVLHECIHAVSYSLGLDLTERQVLGLEAGLYDLLASNPQFASYLKKK